MTQNLRIKPRARSIAGVSLMIAALLMAMPAAVLSEMTPVSYTLDDISEITIDSSILDVEMVTTDSNELLLNWVASDSWDIDIVSDDNGLTIAEKSRIGLHSIGDLSGSKENRKLHIEIPRDYQGSVSIQTRTGSITLTGVDLAGNITLDASYGAVDISEVHTAGSLHVLCNIGNLTVKDSTSQGPMLLEAKTGTVLLARVESGDLLDITNQTGMITLKDTQAETMEIATRFGAVDSTGGLAANAIHVYSFSGDISFQVDGTADDYTLDCIAKVGRSNVPALSQDGEKLLEIETELGNIDVTFADA